MLMLSSFLNSDYVNNLSQKQEDKPLLAVFSFFLIVFTFIFKYNLSVKKLKRGKKNEKSIRIRIRRKDIRC